MTATDVAPTTLVVQSHEDARPAWIDRCVASVEEWAARRGHGYERLGDELLDLAPAWVADRAEGVLPVTDVARLALIRDRLDRGWARVAWLDADVLVFGRVDLPAGLAVGWEAWVTGGPCGSLRTLDLVNNAVLVASSEDRDAVTGLLAATLDEARTAPCPIHPRRLGPDLFTKLHRERPFSLVESVTLASPPVVRGIAEGGSPAVDRFRDELHRLGRGRVGALNLCASMGGTAWPDVEDPTTVFKRAVDALLARGLG